MPQRPTAYSSNARPPSAAWSQAIDAQNHNGIIRPATLFNSQTDTVSPQLPPLAAAKLARLRREVEELLTLTHIDFEKEQEARFERVRMSARIAQLQDPSVGSHRVDETHPSMIEARADFEWLGAQIESLKSVQDERAKLKNALAATISNIERVVKASPPDTEIRGFELGPLDVTEAPALAVEKVRRRIRELRADRAAAEVAPLPSEVMRANGLKQIEALARQGQINFDHFIDHGGSIRFAEKHHSFESFGFVAQEGAPRVHVTVGASLPDGIATVAYLFQDQIIAKLDEAIARGSDDAEALSDEARALRLAEIDAELLATERIEEAYLELCGPDVIRRADANPLAVFSIAFEPKGATP